MLIHRFLWGEIEKWMKRPEILIIKGPRQSGKTTTLKYLQSKYGGEYITLENPNILETLRENPKAFIERYIKNKILYIDEAQYCKKIGKYTKLWYDLYKGKLKILLSGSGSFDIKVEVGRYLVGRGIYFELLPLSFGEFIYWKDKSLFDIWEKMNSKIKKLLNGKKTKIEKQAFEREFYSYLNEYLIYGGYPAIVLEEDFEMKKKMLTSLFQTYIERDVFRFLNVKNIEKYSSLIKILSANIGGELNISNISRYLDSSYKTIEEYIYLLSQTGIIILVPPYTKNKIREIRKQKRLYFLDMGLRNAILDNFINTENREDKGKIFENFIAREVYEYKPRYYRKTSGAEIDFIVDGIPIEVKSLGKPKKPFYDFIKSSKYKYGIVVCKCKPHLKNNTYWIPTYYF